MVAWLQVIGWLNIAADASFGQLRVSPPFSWYSRTLILAGDKHKPNHLYALHSYPRASISQSKIAISKAKIRDTHYIKYGILFSPEV